MRTSRTLKIRDPTLIRAAVAASGLTAAEYADLIRRPGETWPTKQTISNYLRGARRHVAREHAARLADAIGVRLDVLFVIPAPGATPGPRPRRGKCDTCRAP